MAAMPETPSPTRARPSGDPGEGLAAVREGARLLPARPGVYRMHAADGEALYVGKARVLRKRVASYAQVSRLTPRLRRMVEETRSVEFVVTEHEAEALLLEANQIKRLRPRYNVLLRDDKSYPYILLRTDHRWPQLLKHRGRRRRDGEYFGPFASAGAVNTTLNALQRAFPLRTCTDSEFARRERPCLQHQIGRCAAPCVGRIDDGAYAAVVEDARRFLGGRGREVQAGFRKAMDEASRAREFERAAVLRDRIRALTQVQLAQGEDLRHVGDADVFATAAEGGQVAVQVFFFRGGRNFGNRTHFPVHAREMAPGEVLEAFISQFYDSQTPPPLVLLGVRLPSAALVAEALSIRAGRRVRIEVPVRGEKRHAVDVGENNAAEALARRLAERASRERLLEGVAGRFGLAAPPRRIEVYDNSHLQGTEPVGAMVVAGPDGFVKSSYRRFNVRAAPPGDDYAMMREVLERRVRRLAKEDPDRSGGRWPDLLLVDGGAGHRRAAAETLAGLGAGDLAVVGVAKGPKRDAGRETFHLAGRKPLELPPDDPVLYFLQRLRDEAHRFAIQGHRARRGRAAVRSELDQVPGIGPRRKKALILHFGSANAVRSATLAELRQVEGISDRVARTIHDSFAADGGPPA